LSPLPDRTPPSKEAKQDFDLFLDKPHQDRKTVIATLHPPISSFRHSCNIFTPAAKKKKRLASPLFSSMPAGNVRAVCVEIGFGLGLIEGYCASAFFLVEISAK
jgi:hypothetical protein